MIPLPKPRGFWDYALFALVMTGMLLSLFWLDASDGIGWADAALALTSAVLFVFVIVLARRGEKAAWIAQPTWQAYLFACIGAFALLFGAEYADAYLVHRTDITAAKLRHDLVFGVLLSVGLAWWSRRRSHRPETTRTASNSARGSELR